jgi:hypothetical protein
LIETDKNVNEGLELVDKALALSPDNYGFIETKGWGLYKAGKYKQAQRYSGCSLYVVWQNAKV